MRTRINHLNALIKEYKDRFKFTTFVLEDGSPFITDSDPLQYLMEHGTETPRGLSLIHISLGITFCNRIKCI